MVYKTMVIEWVAIFKFSWEKDKSKIRLYTFW